MTSSLKLRVIAQVLPFLLIAPGLTAVQAQEPPSRGEAIAAMTARPLPATALYTRQQIDQLIAPIALYPDELLAQVLMAATYPQQLLDASDWLQDTRHAALQGDQLFAELEPLPWDPSVKALVAFPQIVAMMTEHLEWTEAVGLAFATQQASVMQRVQALRQLAVKSGRIRNVKHLTVQRDANFIRLVSAEPDRVFVPVYNPNIVYGPWPDRDNPPIYMMPPPRPFPGRETFVETVEPGFAVYSYPVVAPLWGWTRPDWRSNQITIRTDEYTRITRDVRPPPDNRWRHQGPVVIVNPPAARTANRTPVQAPAGTVAPAQAAAVTMLPQQAARHQPDKVRIEQAAGPAGSGTTGANTAGNRSPEESPRSQAGQPAAQQTGARPENVPAEKAQADERAAEKAQADKVAAEKAKADKARAADSQADKAAAEKAQADKARAANAQADKGAPEKAQVDKMQAEKAQGAKAQAERAQVERVQAEKAQAEQARAAKAQAEKAQAETAHTRAERDSSQRHQAAGPEARPSAKPSQVAPTNAPSQSAGAARQSPIGETRGQGSSTPPAAGSAARGREPAGGHPSAHASPDKKQPDSQDR